MSDLVSVILTTYNNPTALLSSIPSVLKQTYKNLEILIVDGGQNKHTMRAVDMFDDKRIVYVKVGDDNSDNRICGNVQYCRNIGVVLSQGKFIAMLDDDDVWSKNKISKQIKLMTITHASLITCQTIKMSGNLRTTDKPLSNPSYNDLLQTFNFSQTSAYFMRKSALILCGGFNEKIRSMHEYDIALRMAKCGMRIDVVQEALLKSYCNNVIDRKYYFIKIAELLDFYKCYGKDMLKHLNFDRILFNVAKTIALLSLYILGYVIKEKVWRVIFKLKEGFQKC